MSDRVREGIKTAAIVLLSVSALFLAFLTGAERIPLYSGRAEAAEDIVSGVDFAAPMTIALTASDGTLFAVRYDEGELANAFSHTMNVAAEALDSAADLRPCSADDFHAALKEPCLYYEYPYPTDARVLAAFLGIRADGLGTLAVKRLVVSPLRLYICDGERYYTADTMTSSSAIAILPKLGTAEVSPAADIDALRGFDTHGALLFTGETEHPIPQVEHPMMYRAMRDELMTALGAGVFINSCYEETDGTFVYIAADFSLRVSAAGEVTYRRTAEVEPAEKTMKESVDAAVSFCLRLVKPFDGDSRLVFAGLEETTDGTTFHFDRMLAGGLAAEPNNIHAASVTVKNGVVTDMRAHIASLNNGNETEAMMDETMACACAGGDFILSYVSVGGEIRPVWAKSPAASKE